MLISSVVNSRIVDHRQTALL